MKGKLSITVGLPGCGKSTWLDKHKDDFVIVCPDDFRFDLTGQYHCPSAEDDVWAQVKRAARVLVCRGYHVVIDATNTNRWARAQWVKIAQLLDVDIDAYVFDTPVDICRSRNSNRSRIVPDEVITRMNNGFQRPDEAEGLSGIFQKRTW